LAYRQCHGEGALNGFLVGRYCVTDKPAPLPHAEIKLSSDWNIECICWNTRGGAVELVEVQQGQRLGSGSTQSEANRIDHAVVQSVNVGNSVALTRFQPQGTKLKGSAADAK